jgi:tRNA-specific 2-thiouridylase
MHAEPKTYLTSVNPEPPVDARSPMNSRVLVAMSGGVDSSVAACLLIRQGYNVAGAYLKLPTFSGASSLASSSSSSSDESSEAFISTDRERENVREICRKLAIPFFCLDDVQKAFQKNVVDYFCQEYLAGRTPNPCIPCNQKIKFGFLLERALSLGFDYLATGHYVSLTQDLESERLVLQRGKDGIKDQSYFLYTLTQSQLQRTLFPLGNYTKEDVRAMAREFDLPVHDKPESQEICFLPQGDYSGFLRDRQGYRGKKCQRNEDRGKEYQEKNGYQKSGYQENGYQEKGYQENGYQEKGAGPILNRSGKVLGYHKGIYSYTIGQRRGLGLYNPSPLYVLAIDPEKNSVTVGEESETYRHELIATQLNWMMIPSLREPAAVLAQIRYRHKPDMAIISPLEGEEQDSVLVRFEKPEKSIAPGQSVVFYLADKVFGGGVIDRVL